MPRVVRCPKWLIRAAIVALLPVTGASAVEMDNSRTAALGVDGQMHDEVAALGAIHLSGVTVYDPDQLINFAVAHVIAAGEVPSAQAVADAITLIYREDGYYLAEVVPSAAPGETVFHVFEGAIEAISVENISPREAAAITPYFDRVRAQHPPRLASLERAVRLASDLAGIEVDTHLLPGTDGHVLVLDGVVRHQSGGIGVEAIPLRPGHSLRAFVNQEFYGAAKVGDLLRLTGVIAHERAQKPSLAGIATYRAPWGHEGHYVEVFGGNTVARRDFDDIQPTYHLRGTDLAAAVGFNVLRDFHRFAYAVPEVEFLDARSKTSVSQLESRALSGRLHVLYGDNYTSGATLRLGATASLGKRLHHAGDSIVPGPRTFAHLRGELSAVTPIGKGGRTSIRLDGHGQLAGTSLPEVERMALGHWPFLRGYAPGEIEGDSALSGLVELAYDVGSPLSRMSVTPILFADAGTAWLHHPRALYGEKRHRTIASVGGGARIGFGSWQLSGWMGLPLADGTLTRKGHPGLYASISKGW